MYHIVDNVSGIFVRGRLTGFDTTPLVHGHIHQNCSRPHTFQHIACDEFGRLCPGHEDSTYNQVVRLHQLPDHIVAGYHSVHVLGHHVVQVTNTVDVQIGDRYVG